MIEFLLTKWWLYLPIIALLLFFTWSTNRKLESRGLAKQTKLGAKRQSFLRKLGAKLGLSGLINYIFPPK